jgi:lipopolysaccharide export system protein LptA
MAHVKRLAIGFAVVLTAYWLYALLAVPWIEPQARWQEKDGGDGPILPPAAPQYRLQLAKWFSPDAWERESPKVLKTEQGMLLFQDYKPLDDGRMEVKPFTLVFFAGGNSASDEKDPRPLIMRAPDGALLHFDRPLDLGRAEIGRLIGGRLLGEIKIHSPETDLGKGDDLEIVTRNVQIDQQQVFTPHDVRFRYGQSHGSGRILSIALLPPNDAAGGKKKSSSASGVKSLELVHVDKVHLHVGGNDKPQPPLEITCQGPFQFDFQQHIATFEDRVDVMRVHPNGPSDQLNCQLLEVHFESREASTAPTTATATTTQTEATAAATAANQDSATGAPSQAMSSLDVRRIVATGHPVVLRAPSAGATARGERLEYDLKTRRIRLEDSKKVMLRDQHHEIEALQVEYQLADPGRLGQIWSAGPGIIRGQLGEDQPQPFEVVWNKELLLRPHEQDHVVSMTGGSSVKFPAMGSLAGEEIHLWLREVPQQPPADGDGKTRYSIVPDRMMALGKVQLDSQQLSGRTSRLEAWFVEVVSQSAGGMIGAAQQTSNSSSSPTSPLALSGNSRDALPVQKFDVTGDLLRVQLLRQDQKTSVGDVTVDGNVRFVETVMRTAEPGQVPLSITGSLLQLRSASSDRATAKVTGQPAQVVARGLTMNGATIQLDRGANRLWIDGPGQMTLPASRDLPGPLPSNAQRQSPAANITVGWKGRMDFNGSTVHFERDVKAQSDQRFALAGTLDVTLTRRVDFANPGETDGIDVRELAFGDGVYIENRSYELRELVSLDQMQSRNLSIDQQTGGIYADGPGWVNSVRRGGDALSTTSPQPPAASGNSSSKQLNYLHVDFQRAMVGNVNKREIQFLDQVKTVYGPVASWDDKLDASRRDGLGEDGVLMTCDKLTVLEMGTPVAGRRPFELEATGNTLVEGRTFTARAERISYAESKQLLVLEGNGRADAELWRQTRIGGPTSRAAARKILYWRTDNRIEVDDARFLDISNLGALKPSPLPPQTAPMRR